MAARSRFDEAVLIAQANGDRQAVAESSLALADLARHHGPVEQARSLCHQALSLQNMIGDLPGIAVSLEKLAALAGVGADAARLFGAAQAMRDAGGYARPPVTAADYEHDLIVVRGELGGDAFAVAWAEGLSLSSREALTYATRRRGARRRPPSGWASLTPAEHDVARLAGEGLTNRQIGERLFVSPRTVGPISPTSSPSWGSLPARAVDIGREPWVAGGGDPQASVRRSRPASARACSRSPRSSGPISSRAAAGTSMSKMSAAVTSASS